MVRRRVEGHAGLELTDNGRGIVIKTGLGPGTEIMDDDLDVFYQDNNADKITAMFILDGDTYTFHVAGWDKIRAIVIDPLVYSTYLGGGSDDYGWGIAVDSSGFVYVTGGTYSTDFPTTPMAYDTSFNGYHDAFVTKLSSDGTSLVYSTYLGDGSDFDKGNDIAVDANGCAYVTGDTDSDDFPTTAMAYDTSYNGDYSDAFVTKLSLQTVQTVPLAPQNLQATADDEYITLSWDPPAEDGGSSITNYKIYRETSSGGVKYLTSVSRSNTTYTDSSLTNGQTYYYQVSAVNSAGEGPKSSEVSATPTSSVMEPSAPRNLQATPGDAQVTLSWSPPADDGGSSITEYKIYRGTSIGAEACYASVDSSTTNYVDGSAVRGLTYYYQVSAANTVGEGPKSNVVSATPFGRPTAPQSLRTMTGDGKVTLTWYLPDDDGGSPIIEYKIYRGTSSGGETYYDSVDGSTTTYTDTNVTSGVTYYYRVSGVNSATEGARSNEASAAPTIPSSGGSTGVDQSSGGENLYWLIVIIIIVVGVVAAYILGSKKR